MIRLLKSKSVYIKIIRSTLLLYVLLGLYGWFLSDASIFFPPSRTYSSDNILFIDTANNNKIAAIYLENSDATHTILYSHGNATDLYGIKNLIQDFYDNGYSVLAYDYSGYGLSDSSPTELRVYENIQSVYDYLVNQRNTRPESIIAYGHSLGGAVAAELASKNPVGGLVLESTFVSAFRVRTIVSLYPFDKFATLNRLASINAPVLIMHSKDDPIINFWHSEMLFSAANSPKMHYWVDRAGHGGVSHTGEPFWNTLTAFVKTFNARL